jgi:hypothetical protein
VPSRHRWDLDVVDDLTVHESVEGRIVVHSGGALTLTGVAEGGVVVLGGGVARITGKTCGLFVAAGGRAVVTGTCQGSVIADGGDVVITGTVTDTSVEQARTSEGPAVRLEPRPSAGSGWRGSPARNRAS